MNRVLMIAFQFPPFAGSSAVQRTLRFVQYLPASGWEPIVLSARPSAYEKASDDLLGLVPASTVVCRAFALDAARHLGIRRRYPAAWARPDRWATWLPAAVWAGMRIVQRYRPSAIWSTFPIPTAHRIAATLHRLTGVPWVADFRDPMVQPNDPPDRDTWRSYERIERMTLARSQLNVFTTEGTRELYRARYPEVEAERFAVVENGYDEDAFAGLQSEARADRVPGSTAILHSGAIYPLERDPTKLFRALHSLRERGALSPTTFKLRLRATGHDAVIKGMLDEFGVADLVELLPPLPYRQALAEMLDADGLLVLQAAEVRTQVPAKLYEYLRAGRPILALTDPESDTARVLRRAGVSHICRIDSVEDIEQTLLAFIDASRDGVVASPDPAIVAGASRRHRAEELAALLARFGR